MAVLETMQEKEEYKILTPLFLITYSWLGALILYKPLGSSWSREGTVLEAWADYVPPSTSWELKPPLCFLQILLHVFYSASVGRESQDFGQQQQSEMIRVEWACGTGQSQLGSWWSPCVTCHCVPRGKPSPPSKPSFRLVGALLHAARQFATRPSISCLKFNKLRNLTRKHKAMWNRLNVEWRFNHT